MKSFRLTWARGLKLVVVDRGLVAELVAPHAGARIETGCGTACSPAARRSRFTQVRGLKRYPTPQDEASFASRLTREHRMKDMVMEGVS